MKKIQFQRVKLCSALIGWKFGHGIRSTALSLHHKRETEKEA